MLSQCYTRENSEFLAGSDSPLFKALQDKENEVRCDCLSCSHEAKLSRFPVDVFVVSLTAKPCVVLNLSRVNQVVLSYDWSYFLEQESYFL